MPTEKEHLRNLVRGIVLAQGNIFIKELLRKMKITIGATKADFERNLLKAIDDGDLTHEDVSSWLNEVEGWGDQHVYLFNVPDHVTHDAMWSDKALVREKAIVAGWESLWEAPTSQSFPESPELTHVSYHDAVFRMIWHKAASSWVRTKARDYDKTIEGDDYQFRAYRSRAERAVMRFELDLTEHSGDGFGKPMAALFVPAPINSAEHEQAVRDAHEEVGKTPPLSAVLTQQMSVGNIIKNMDHAKVAAPTGLQRDVSADATRLAAGGAYVEFKSTSPDHGYAESAPVMDVRLSIQNAQLGDFVGSSGSFEFRKQPTNELSRDVRVQLFGGQRRIRIWKRLKAKDVWLILRTLANYQ